MGLACAHAGGGGMPFSSSPGEAVAFGGGRGRAPGRAGIERPRRCCSEFFSDSLSDLGLGGGRGGGRAGGTAPFFAPFFFTGLCSFFFTDVGRGFGGGGPTDPSPLVVRKLFGRSFIVAPDELLPPPLFARALGLGGGGPGRDGGGGAPTFALLLGLLGGGGFGLGGGPGGGSRAPTGTCVPLLVLAGLWCSSTGGGLPCEPCEEPLRALWLGLEAMAAIVRHEPCGGGGGGDDAADCIDDDCDDASLLAFVPFVPFVLALGGGPEGSGGAAAFDPFVPFVLALGRGPEGADAFESIFRIVPGLLGPALGGGCGLGGGPGDFGDFGDFVWVAGEAAAARAIELGGGPGGGGGNGDFFSDSRVPVGGVRGGGGRGGGSSLFPFSMEEMEEMEDRRTQSAAPENEESLGRPCGDACGEPGDAAPPTLLAADGRCPFRSVSVSGGEPGGGGPMSDISGTPERLERVRPEGAEDGGPPTSEPPRTDQSSETKRGGGRSAVEARPSPLSSASFLTSAAGGGGVSPAPPSTRAPREMETLREEDRVRDGGGGGGALASAPPTPPPMRSPRETEALREEERVRVAEERLRTRDLLFRREPVGLSIVASEL